MADRRIEGLRSELHRLMMEQIDSLQKQTFEGPNEEVFRQHEERLKRIREVSADLLATMKREMSGESEE